MRIEFGTHEGAFAVYTDGILVGFTQYGTYMDRVREAGMWTGNQPRDLCRWLGTEVLAAYEKHTQDAQAAAPKLTARQARAIHYQQLKGGR